MAHIDGPRTRQEQDRTPVALGAGLMEFHVGDVEVIRATRPDLLVPNREDSHEYFIIDMDEDSACPV